MDRICVLRISQCVLRRYCAPGHSRTWGVDVAQIESDVHSQQHQPIDAVAERLNDPAVAASLVTLLDNAELLSTLVLGLGGLIERGDVIMDSIGEAVSEVQKAGPLSAPDGAPSLGELAAAAGAMTNAAPLLSQVLDSSMARPETIDLLSMMSDAAAEGVANARANGTRINGAWGAMKSLKDPEVQRGLGLVTEIARSLGRRMESTNASAS